MPVKLCPDASPTFPGWASPDRRSSTLRIALFAPQFPEYSLEYARAMSKFCDVRAVVDAKQFEAEYEGRVPDAQDLAAVRLVDFRMLRELVPALVWLGRFRPHVVHIQEPAALRKLLLSAFLLALFRPFAKTVLTIHDPVPHAGADAAVAERSTIVRRWLRARASAVVVHGWNCRNVYRQQQHVPRQRVIVSSHGLILRPVEPTPLTETATLRILFFGRMQAYKGLNVLLETVKLLHLSRLNFSIVVAGEGCELDRLKAQFETFAEVEIEAGYLRSDRVIELIRSCHCVVLPYLSATQSGVLAAAFAGGRFVVASRVGGLQDMVQDMKNGLLVPPGDAPALARALHLVARDAQLRRMLSTGAERTARTVLDWTNIARLLHLEYKALCRLR